MCCNNSMKRHAHYIFLKLVYLLLICIIICCKNFLQKKFHLYGTFILEAYYEI